MPATCWRTSATTAARCWNGCVSFPLDPFRISYAYTNFGFTAGAEAVAASAGKPWDVLADDVLFDPLGMTSTSYRFADYEARANRAVGHIHVDGKYEPLYVRDADPQGPAGGVSSSVNDMTRWLAMVLANGSHDGKQIVDADALLPAITPQIVSSPASRTRDAIGLLRIRIQHRHDVRRRERNSAIPVPSNSERGRTS